VSVLALALALAAQPVDAGQGPEGGSRSAESGSPDATAASTKGKKKKKKKKAVPDTPEKKQQNKGKKKGKKGKTADRRVTPPKKAARGPDRQADDASVDRNVLFPTAEVQPSGHFVITDVEGVCPGAWLTLWERLQVGAAGAIPVVDGMPAVVMTGAKLKILSSEQFLFSVVPWYIYASANDDDTRGHSYGALGVADILFDPEGTFVLTAGAGLGAIHASGPNYWVLADMGIGLMFAGANLRLGDWFKIMAELIVPAAYDGAFHMLTQGIVFDYGVRVYGSMFSIDASMLMLADSDYRSDDFPLGFPWIGLSLRL
jgi:hypothetical protein